MGIGFTGGLEQRDILSDGTPFDGADIDAPISSVGGVDWASKTPKFDSGSDDTTGTVLNVSGSGFAISLYRQNENIGIDIDGTTVIPNDSSNSGWVPLLYRFDSSLEITDSDFEFNDWGVAYVLD